jgi:hypothetical protein
MVNRLKFNLGYKINNHLEVFGGAAFNVALSKLRNDEGRITGSSLVPTFHFYESVIGNTHMKIYPGFNLGLRVL